MRKTKSTPGPWSYRSEYHDDWGVVRGPATDLGLEWIVAIADAGRRVDSREYAAHRENGTDPYEANARLIAAAPAFLAACQGSDPDVSALEWLSSLLGDLHEQDWPGFQEDPEGAWAALEASQTLLAALRAAVAQATDEDVPGNLIRSWLPHVRKTVVAEATDEETETDA